MALILYPTTGYDSFISEADATTLISSYSLQSSQWLALDVPTREVYLRIATSKILSVVSTDTENLSGYLDPSTYEASTSCIPNSCALMAINDVVYQISAEINPNTGLISSEQVGDLKVTYFHGANTSSRQLSSKNKNPFPLEVRSCLMRYGASFSSSGIAQTTLERS